MANENDNSFRCDVCNKSFSKLWILKRHVQVHAFTKKTRNKARKSSADAGKMCSSTGSTTKFDTEDKLKDTSEQREQSVASASSMYTAKAIYSGEAVQVEETTIESVKILEQQKQQQHNRKSCNVCNRKRFSSEDLRIHDAFHKNGKYTCHICHKVLAVHRDKIRHMKIHTGSDLLKCTFCEKLFVQKTDLERHMRLHTGDRPYQCAICGRAFSRQSTLTRHTLTHTGERPYTCDNCGQSFTRPYFLRNHMSEHGTK